MTTDVDRRVIEATMRARGLWNDDGIGRRARARRCPKCGAPVMVGLDSEPMGRAVSCDPVPLSAVGEATVLMMDRFTFSLIWINGHYEIDFRDSFRITGCPAGTDHRREIIAAHECGATYSITMRAAYALPIAATTTKGSCDDNDEPPF